MLKRSYQNEADIPTEYRSQYVQKDGKFVLDVEGFDNVEGVLTKSQELLAQHATDKSEITSLKGQVTRLSNDKTELSAKAIPDGHVVIPVADKQILDAVKPLGDPAEISAKLTEYPTLKAKVDEQANLTRVDDIARVMGWNTEAARAIADRLPETEIRDRVENGQVVKNDKGEPEKVVIAKLKNEQGAVTEKNLADYYNETPSLKVFERSLLMESEQTTVPFPRQSAQGGSREPDLSASLIKDRYLETPAAAGK